MDLRAIEVFCKIVELRSFSLAAEAVLLTQPTVSGHVKALEAELGIRLLDRSGRRVTPTKAGEILHAYGQRLLALRGEVQQAISEHKGGLSGHLVVGASSIPGAYLLPALLTRFKRDQPEVTITLHVRASRDIVRSVLDGTCEIGVVGGRFDDGRVHYAPFAEDQLVLAVPADHAWADRGSVRPEELRGQPFVMRERGSGTRQTAEEALAAHGLDPRGLRVVMEVTNNEAVRQALKAGAGVSIISRRSIEDDIRCRLLAALRVRGLSLVRDFHLVTHKSRARSPLGAAFLAFLERSRQSARRST
jgi:DNA-binding transcriptional LysR family regulator